MIKFCSSTVDSPRDKTIIITTPSPANISCSELLRFEPIRVKVWSRTEYCLLYVLWNENPEAKESNPGDQVWIFDESIWSLKINCQSEEAGQKEKSGRIWQLKSQELKPRKRLTNGMRRWTLLYAHAIWGKAEQVQGCPLPLKDLVAPV